MAQFGMAVQSTEVQALIQQNLLERLLYDTLFPQMMYRSRCEKSKKEAHEGESGVMSAMGLMTPDLMPKAAGQDPVPEDFSDEQWDYTIQSFKQASKDVDMPTDYVAFTSLLAKNYKALGRVAAQVLNRLPRNTIYNAGLAGNTNIVTGVTTGSGTTTLAVARLNGFTRARRPGVSGASPVRFELVSSTNPLPIRIYNAAGALQVVANVVGFTPTNTYADGTLDEKGPGTLSLTHSSSYNSVSLTARWPVLADDRSVIFREGGGQSIDALTAGTDILTMATVQAAAERMTTQNVPTRPDGWYHCDLPPKMQTQLMSDTVFRQLFQTKGLDNDPYGRNFIGTMFGIKFYLNNEAPQVANGTVYGNSATAAGFDLRDPFGGELWTTGATTGSQVMRASIIGGEAVFEKYIDFMDLVSDAGITGITAGVSVDDQSITSVVENVRMITRAPLNRTMDQVSTAYAYRGTFVARTDACSGDEARYKRVAILESVAA